VTASELPLRSMQARVTIDGFRARVLIDYVYDNDRGRQLEGNFQLRLPEEASPYFFAFGESNVRGAGWWVAADGDRRHPTPATPARARFMAARETSWRNPREARMVPREKAQIAYGATVRRRVDPAMVEWAGAGVFNARVFPLAPHRLHRIVVGYDVDLVRIGDGLEYRFDLPAKVPAASIDVALARSTPAIVAPPGGGDGRRGADALPLREPLERRRPRHGEAARRGSAATILGGDDKIGELFASRVQPALPAALASGGPGAAVFMVDTSLSSNPNRFNIYLHLLRAVLDHNRDSIPRFAVMFFGVDAWWYKPGFVDNTPRNVEALLGFAGQLALEGATDLGAALAEASHPVWLPEGSRHDVFLLSDGAATWARPTCGRCRAPSVPATRCSRTRPGWRAPTWRRCRSSHGTAAAPCSR